MNDARTERTGDLLTECTDLHRLDLDQFMSDEDGRGTASTARAWTQPPSKKRNTMQSSEENHSAHDLAVGGQPKEKMQGSKRKQTDNDLEDRGQAKKPQHVSPFLAYPKEGHNEYI